MTHKLATWFDQFGTRAASAAGAASPGARSAIDITEEVAAIRASEARRLTADRRRESPRFAGLGAARSSS